MISGILFSFSALLMSFFITYKSIPVIIRVSNMKGLTDEPDGKRKLHQNITPNLGGVGIFAGFIIAYSTTIYFKIPSYFPALIASLTILFFLGIKDDILMIAPLKKLFGQILAAIIIVFLGDIKISGLDGILGIAQMSPFIAKLFSVFVILFIINAYNLIDGVDGLAGMLAIVASYAMGLWFIAGGHYVEAILCLALAGALVGFMFHNFEPARIFMGDTGSLLIGFLLSVAAFRLTELNSMAGSYVLKSPAVFILSVMSIPIFDTFRIIFVRLSKGTSPFKADTNHIHHILIRSGMRHYQVALTLALINTFIIAISLLIHSWNVYAYLAAVIVLSLSVVPAILFFKDWIVRTFVTTNNSANSDLLFDDIRINEIMNQTMKKDFQRTAKDKIIKKEEYSYEV